MAPRKLSRKGKTKMRKYNAANVSIMNSQKHKSLAYQLAEENSTREAAAIMVNSSAEWNSDASGWNPEDPAQEPVSLEAPVWEQQLVKEPINVSQLQREGINDMVEKACKGWPWTEDPSKALMAGPFIQNPYYVNDDPMQARFHYGFIDQGCLLFKMLLSNDLIATQILGYVATHYIPLWHFTSTCQQAWGIVVQNMGLWITNERVYNMCNLKPEQLALVEAHMWRKYERARRREELAGNPTPPEPYLTPPSVKPIMVVTPMRCFKDPTMHSSTYQKDVKELKHLCRAIYNFGEYIRNISFHRVPFLTVDMLAVLVPSMKTLTSLGVQKCQLIHIGDGLRLLEIIRVDRLKGKEDSVNLDWYPNFHFGPPEEDTSEFALGSYGVTWDNWNGDTPLGTWRLVQRIVLQARQQGIEIEGKHTSFRKWLDDGPCWRVDETMKALFKIQTRKEHIKVCALVSAHDANHHGNPKKFTRKLAHQPEGWEWKIKNRYCSRCGTITLGIFFPYGEVYAKICDDTHQMQCWACRLLLVLNTENDHYKDAKRDVIHELLVEQPLEGEDSDPNYWPKLNTTDLKKVLDTLDETDDKGHSRILSSAHNIQLRREAIIANPKYGNDRETHEHQRKFTKKEQSTLYGTQHRSPTIAYKRQDPQTREGDEVNWNSARCTRTSHRRDWAW